LFFSLFNLINSLSIGLSLITICILERNQIHHLARSIIYNIREFIEIIPLGLLITLQALYSPPTTTDALNYHLVRVYFWLQNGSSFQNQKITTHDYMPKFGNILQLWAFAIGGDWLAWLPQFLSWIGLGILSYLLFGLVYKSKDMEYKKRVVYIITSMPMLVLQASSTQIDLISTFYFLLSMYFLITYLKKSHLKLLLYAVTAFCFALLTKPTVIFASAILLVIVVPKIKGIPLTHKLLSLIFFIVFSASWIIDIFYNYGYLAITQPQGNENLSYITGKLTIGSTIVAVLKNMLLQLPIPLFDIKLHDLLSKLAQIVNAPLNDITQNFNATQFSVRKYIYPQEDVASNPIQLLLIFWGTCAVKIQKFNSSTPVRIFWGAIIGFILFSTVLRWQPWHSRLHIPFIIAALLAVFALTKIKHIKQISYLSLLVGYAMVLLNTSKPYIDYTLIENQVSHISQEAATIPKPFWQRERTDAYFISQPNLYKDYSTLSYRYKNNDVCEISKKNQMMYGLIILVNQNRLQPCYFVSVE